jgi:hypothetical protein
MSNVHQLFPDIDVQKRDLKELERQFDGGGGGGYDGGMEARVAKLESIAEKTSERFGALDTNIAVIRTLLEEMNARVATKADVAAARVDMHKEINAQTWKLVTFVSGFGTALAGAVYFIATHIK